MTAREILLKVSRKEITKADIRRSLNLKAHGYDEKIKAGFLGFMDGNIVKVDKPDYDMYVALAKIMGVGHIYDVTESRGNDSVLESIKPIISLARQIDLDNRKRM